MTPEERREQALAVEKSIIIERIKVRVEDLGGTVDGKRTAAMREMSKPDLDELAISVFEAKTARQAIDEIVRAITAAAAARRQAEDAKFEGLPGSVQVTM